MNVYCSTTWEKLWSTIAVALVYFKEGNEEMDLGDVKFLKKEDITPDTKDLLVIGDASNINNDTYETPPIDAEVYLWLINKLGKVEYIPEHSKNILVFANSKVLVDFKLGVSLYGDSTIDKLIYTLFGSTYTNQVVESVNRGDQTESTNVEFLNLMINKGMLARFYLENRKGELSVEEFLEIPHMLTSSKYVE